MLSRLMSRALIGATLLSPAAAMAGVVTDYSATLNQTAFDSSGNVTIALPAFDPSLGTLTSATLTLAGVTGPQFEVINLGSAPGTGVGSTTVTYSVTGPGLTSLSEAAGSGSQTVSVSGGAGTLASSAPTVTPFLVASALANLAALSGAGPVDFVVNQSFSTSGSSSTVGATLAFGGTSSANFGLNVAYDFTPADEPAPVALIGTALVGLGLLRARRA